VILVGEVPTMTGDDLRYARNGEIHVAYEVLGLGGGVDVVLSRTCATSCQARGSTSPTGASTS
jgi:hypothetical protein